MQHIVSLVQLGVLRSVRAGGVLHCNTPPARTLLKTPSCTKDTICCICKGNYKFYCSWRWAYKPETCRAKINKYSHQVGNWLLFQTICKVQPSKMFLLLHFQVSATLHRSPLYAKWTRMTYTAHLCSQCILTTTEERMFYLDVKLTMQHKTDFSTINAYNWCTEMCA